MDCIVNTWSGIVGVRNQSDCSQSDVNGGVAEETSVLASKTIFSWVADPGSQQLQNLSPRLKACGTPTVVLTGLIRS